MSEWRASRIYLDKNVYEASLERLDYVFSEFDEVVVGVSGGKDSTVLLFLALQVAKDRKRLPLKVFFIDEEFEYQATVDYLLELSRLDDILFYWYQIPLSLECGVSVVNNEVLTFDPAYKDKWVHGYIDGSIRNNVYGSYKWETIFPKILQKDFQTGGNKVASLTGMRAEESPKRQQVFRRDRPSYKNIVWSTVETKNIYAFHPIYDWTHKDVWHAILSNKWPYNPIYDKLAQAGMPYNKLRVSSFIHEMVNRRSLDILHIVEPETFDKALQRIPALDTLLHIDYDKMIPKTLPPMFTDWFDYRDYLLENLITDPEAKAKLRKGFDRYDKYLRYAKNYEEIIRAEILSILTSDLQLNRLTTKLLEPGFQMLKYYLEGRKGNRYEEIHPRNRKYLIKGLYGILKQHDKAGRDSEKVGTAPNT